MTEEVKACPLCGESILAVAKKCKHCGSTIDGSEQGSAASDKPAANYESILLAIPIISTVLIWFWVSGMNLLQSPGDTMNLIMIVTILGTAITAAMEASKVGMSSDRVKGTQGPVGWFFVFILLWFIAYPYYLFKRKHYGLANRLVAGILVMLIFIGSFSAMSAAIEKKKAEVRGNLEQLQNNLNSLSAPNKQPEAVVAEPSHVVEEPPTGVARPEIYEEYHALNCKMINGHASEGETNRFNDLVSSLSEYEGEEHQRLLDKASASNNCG